MERHPTYRRHEKRKRGARRLNRPFEPPIAMPTRTAGAYCPTRPGRVTTRTACRARGDEGEGLIRPGRITTRTACRARGDEGWRFDSSGPGTTSTTAKALYSTPSRGCANENEGRLVLVGTKLSPARFGTRFCCERLARQSQRIQWVRPLVFDRRSRDRGVHGDCVRSPTLAGTNA